MQNPASFIARLLQLHSELLPKGHGGAPCPNDALTNRISKSIDEACDDDVPTALAQQQYNQWWSEFATATRPAHEKLRAAHLILAQIDDHFSHQPPKMEKLADNTWIMLGAKLWDRKRPRKLPRDNRAFFPSLRWSASARLNYRGAHEHIHAGFERAGAKLKIRLHCLRRDTVAHFQPTREIDLTSRTVGFRLENLRRRGLPVEQGVEEYYKEIEGVTRAACDEGVHILCLPELCVSENALPHLESALKGSPTAQLFLILAGSHHRADGDGLVNVCPVYVRRLSAVENMVYASKRERVSYSVAAAIGHEGLVNVLSYKGGPYEQLAEDIIPSQHYTILLTPIGLVAVVICKDAITSETEFGDLCRLVDHVFVISMNSAAGWFTPRLTQLSTLHRTAFYFVNCQHSAVLGSGVECAGWVWPGMEGKARFLVPPGSGVDKNSSIADEGAIDFLLDIG